LLARFKQYRGTGALVVVVSVVAALQAALPEQGDLDAPTRWLGWSAPLVSHGQWWRFVTPDLVNPANNGLGGHTSAGAHYALNLLGLVVLGTALERRVGWRRLLLIAVVSGTVGYGSLALTHPHATGYDGGTSGIVAGIGGSLVVWLWAERTVGAAAKLRWWLAVVIVTSVFLLSTTWAANVNQTHGVAFVVGVALAALLRRSDSRCRNGASESRRLKNQQRNGPSTEAQTA